MKVVLGSLIRNSVKILTSEAIIDGSGFDLELEKFMKVFNAKYKEIFTVAEYDLLKKRQRVNRKPRALPAEDELDALRQHLTKELDRGAKGFPPSDFVHFRRLALARITLLNGRRGSEAARMTIADFVERDEWIDRSKMTAQDTEILLHYTVTFTMGKGSTLVPIIIPKNCEAILSRLTDSNFRQAAGVNPRNPFIFAYKSESLDPVTGYDDLNTVCKNIGITTIDATSNRHRTATLFWEMKADDHSIDLFMSHLGHSRAINESIYSVPPVLSTLRTVVPIVSNMDKVRMNSS
jgi:integrase